VILLLAAYGSLSAVQVIVERVHAAT
jgi:hypothetical protein